MFGEFGNSSHRQRVPRDHSPFGSFPRSHHPMFPGGEWEDDFRHTPSPNFNGSESSKPTNGHVERIIPIQIVGSTSNSNSAPQQPQKPPQQTPQRQHHDDVPKQSTGEPSDLKNHHHRNNTEEKINMKPENEKTRAKSEPPMQWVPNGKVAGGARASAVPPQTATTHPTETQQPKPPEMAQFGSGSSKTVKEENGEENTAGCFRNIPIFVEGRGPFGGGAARRQQGPPPSAPSPSSNAQKTRFQPDRSESSPTPPPPPPKKVTKDTLQIIQEIVDEVLNLETQVNALSPTQKTAKAYMYLDEMLTRSLIKLDTIETEGKDDIRNARRDCIKLIQKVISILESKTQEKNEDSTALVPFSPTVQSDAPPQDFAASASVDSNNVVNPDNLAVVAVSTETAMEVSPTSENSNPPPPNNNSTAPVVEEPMAIEEKVAA